MPIVLHYRVVDVFSRVPLEGNPLAVFSDARALDTPLMQKIAAELSLSETVFLLPASNPSCAARARIFTPTVEMRFAGHPTLGAAFVLADAHPHLAEAGEFTLEEEVGPVPVRVERGPESRFWLQTPPLTFGAPYERAVAAAALGLEEHDLLACAPSMVTAGNPCIFIPVRDKAAVDRSFLDMSGYRKLHPDGAEPKCVFVFAPTPEGAYSRMFGPGHGIVEDPATGSATGPLAAYMMRNGLMTTRGGTRFVSEQGTKMGRRSFLHVLVHGEGGRDGIEVGGHVTPLVSARMTLHE